MLTGLALSDGAKDGVSNTQIYGFRKNLWYSYQNKGEWRLMPKIYRKCVLKCLIQVINKGNTVKNDYTIGEKIDKIQYLILR